MDDALPFAARRCLGIEQRTKGKHAKRAESFAQKRSA
jgi:hypothetical protein